MLSLPGLLIEHIEHDLTGVLRLKERKNKQITPNSKFPIKGRL
jgi:hypothetical protein